MGDETVRMKGQGNDEAIGPAWRATAVDLRLDPSRARTYNVTFRELLHLLTNANGHAFEFLYDPMDRLERVIDPTDNQTVYGYHPEGTLESRTDARNRTTGYGYDPLGRLTTVVNALNGVTGFELRPSGFLDNVIDGNGYMTQYSYDNVGRVTRVASWDSGTMDYTYYPDGTLHTKTDDRNITATYSYDTSSRLTLVSFPDASENRSYSYDAVSSSYGRGRLTGTSDPSGSAVYHYDALGRLSSEAKTILGVAYTTSYAYDNVGNLTSQTYPSGRTVEYFRNEVDRPTLVRMTRQGVTTVLASGIAYDNVDQLTSMTLGNGLVEGRTYDSMDRLSTIAALPAMSLSFDYDAVGNIVELTDSVHELSSPALGATAYTYLANRLDNVVEGSTTKTYGYDNTGNTVWDGALEYQYNQDGRLKKVLSGQTTVGEYVYDGRGHRAIKTAGGQTVVFHYDRFDRLIAETDASGNLLVEYVYLEERPLAQARPAGGSAEATYYYHVDHLGTPKTLTDSSQQVAWAVPLDEFGNELAAGARTVENNLRFPGQYHDAETGLHQNYFRDYDPKTGRYIQPDPIGVKGLLSANGTYDPRIGIYSQTHLSLLENQQPNLYTYVNNDPINRLDPYGLYNTWKSWAGAIIGGVGFVIKNPPLMIIGAGLVIWDWMDVPRDAEKMATDVDKALKKLDRPRDRMLKELENGPCEKKN